MIPASFCLLIRIDARLESGLVHVDTLQGPLLLGS